MLGIAQTGTGKTAAFALPILDKLAKETFDKATRNPRALILAPTRELAIQIGEEFRLYSKFMHLRHSVIFGGVSQKSQVTALHRGIDILIATPGRLLDLKQQRLVKLNKVKYLVLDEADRMLRLGMVSSSLHRPIGEDDATEFGELLAQSTLLEMQAMQRLGPLGPEP